MNSRQGLKIAELERRTGVRRSTIHHYLNLGLLPRPAVHGPKLHLFTSMHEQQLREIQKLRERGWSLARIRHHLDVTTAAPRRQRGTHAHADGIKQRIVDYATQCFAERGYEGVHLSDVARVLGIGKATIYRHFASKQALFVDCVERLRFTLIPKEAREVLDARDSAEERAYHRALAVLQHFSAYRTLTHMLGALAHGADADLASRARAELHGMVTNAEPFLRQLRDEKLIRRIDPELLAYMLWGALIYAGERMTMDDTYRLDDVLATYLDFVAFGMRGEPRASPST